MKKIDDNLGCSSFSKRLPKTQNITIMILEFKSTKTIAGICKGFVGRSPRVEKYPHIITTHDAKIQFVFGEK